MSGLWSRKGLRSHLDLVHRTKIPHQNWQLGQQGYHDRPSRPTNDTTPDQPLELCSLRPISATSCVGKAAEHVILNRATQFAEDRNLLPFNQSGFRPSMPTKDVMLLLKHKMIAKASRDTRAILTLDLEKVFVEINALVYSIPLRKRAQENISTSTSAPFLRREKPPFA
ncbi:hypothetical protein HPB52_016845 [Rhipicephalus sanguineus]|uniref:Reverse transcriptase domain-containing protein n=1 Tax=Rhipicephalus sanguineus TaxID=34632 RepID=A0A9D4T5S8_RHISA|nr:hypothetical protein HPB52_016845 [Rhipicephalus sanguineus]